MPKSRPSKEYAAFERLTDQLLTVPKVAIDARVKAHREQASQNPNKRGPKPKIKSSAGDASRADAS